MRSTARRHRHQTTGAPPNLVLALLSLTAAGVLTGTGGNWAPTWLAAGGMLVGAVLYLRLGRTAGWWSLPLATVTIFVVGVAASALSYDEQAGVPPDLRVSGMDEIGRDPASVILVLPFIWVLLVLAVVSRRSPRTANASTGV